MFFKDFVSVKRKKIKKGASQTYDTPSRVDFRKKLKVQGSTCSFSKVQEITFIFSNVKEVLVGFQKTSLNAKEVFRKPFLSPIS